EDDSAGKGWRQPTPPPGNDDVHSNKGGENVEFSEERLKELNELLEVDELSDEVIVERVKQFSEDAKTLTELRKEVDSKKKFAEEYPAEAERMKKLEEREREREIIAFSESFADKRIT